MSKDLIGDLLEQVFMYGVGSTAPDIASQDREKAYLNLKRHAVAKGRQAIDTLLAQSKVDELKLLDEATKQHVYIERDGYLKDRIATLTAPKEQQ